MRHYSNSDLEQDPHALPDVEIFRSFYSRLDCAPIHHPKTGEEDGWYCGQGYYYVFGLPDHGWDSEPEGPYGSEAEALIAAREEAAAEQACKDGRAEYCEPERH